MQTIVVRNANTVQTQRQNIKRFGQCEISHTCILGYEYIMMQYFFLYRLPFMSRCTLYNIM